MNAYETGKYRLHLFDKHGTKQETVLRDNLIQAQEDGHAMTKEPPYASFVVTRVLFNSIDRADPWNCRNK